MGEQGDGGQTPVQGGAKMWFELLFKNRYSKIGGGFSDCPGWGEAQKLYLAPGRQIV